LSEYDEKSNGRAFFPNPMKTYFKKFTNSTRTAGYFKKGISRAATMQ
jgi:hypothetical protein